MKTCLVVLLAFVTLQGHAQSDQRIDSLKSQLTKRTGLDRFDVLYDIVFEYLGKEDYRHSLEYVEQAKEIAYQFGDSLQMVKAGRVKAQVLRRLDRTTDAIHEFLLVLPISRRNDLKSEYKFILNGLAIAYMFQANYDKALQYHFESLVLREKEGNSEYIGVTLNNIGLVYFKLRNFEKALEYYKRAFDHKINFKDQLLINMGLCYAEVNDFTSAKKFIDDGLKLCAPNCNEETLMSGEFGLGKALFRMDKAKDAEIHFQNSCFHLITF